MENKKETLEEVTDKVLKDENAQAEAVTSLLKVDKRKQGENSDVELKTEIPNGMILNLHTSLDVVGNWLEQTFKEKCILTELIHKRERKSISLQRKSRAEIVAVARNPDITTNQATLDEGMLKRFFTSRK